MEVVRGLSDDGDLISMATQVRFTQPTGPVDVDVPGHVACRTLGRDPRDLALVTVPIVPAGVDVMPLASNSRVRVGPRLCSARMKGADSS